MRLLRKIRLGLPPVWLLMAACAGCDDGDGEAGDPAPDGGLLDRGLPGEWDAGDDGSMRITADAAPPREDAALPACFAERGTLAETFVSEPIAGAAHLRADVDFDADGRPDLLVEVHEPTGIRLELFDGRSAEPLGTVALPGAERVQVLPGVSPRGALVAPLPVGGTAALVVLEQRRDGPLGLRVVDAATRNGVRFIELPRGAERVALTPGGSSWLALVDEPAPEAGCAVFDVGTGEALLEQGRCRLAPGWDANGDTHADVVLSAASGTALLDGRTLEQAAHNGVRMTLGFAPATPEADGGPLDVRGRGPELVGATIEANQLQVRYLDPLGLNPDGEPQIVPGKFERAEFLMSAGGLRLVAQEERGGLRYLHVLEPSATLRRRAEFGPFRYLTWFAEADVDGDGFPEIRLLGGSREDGTQTDLVYLRTADGTPAFTIAAERGGRFDGVWRAAGPYGAPSDLDGCPGDDLVVIRRGNPTRDGQQATRLLVFAAGGREVHRGEGHDGFVRELAIADLAGDGVAELIELRGDQRGEARLRIHAAR